MDNDAINTLRAMQGKVDRLEDEIKRLRVLAAEAWRMASYHNDEATEEFEREYVDDLGWLEELINEGYDNA